jgi:hypothetical protein
MSPFTGKPALIAQGRQCGAHFNQQKDAHHGKSKRAFLIFFIGLIFKSKFSIVKKK